MKKHQKKISVGSLVKSCAWFLGRHAFLAILICIAIDICIALALTYDAFYVPQVTALENSSQASVFYDQLYQKVTAWQQSRSAATNQNNSSLYQNPFP